MKGLFSRVWTIGNGSSFVVALPDDAPAVPPGEEERGIQRERHDHLVQEVKRTLKRGHVLLEERLLSEEWEQLHKQLGSDMIYFLLKYALVFDDRTKQQLCGPPLERCYFDLKKSKKKKKKERRFFYNETFTEKPGIHLSECSRNQAKKLCKKIFDCDRLHKRLNGAVSMMHKLLKNHKKLRYGFLLRVHCPLPHGFLFRENEEDADEELTWLEDITGGGRSFSYEELLAGGRCSHHQVTCFIWSCLMRLVPSSAWGCEENKKRTRKWISEHVVEGRNSSCDWKIKSCWWIPRTKTRAQDKVHKQMAQQWLQWLLNDVVIPLIRNHFYVTETSFDRKGVYYFRKPLWRAMVQLQTQKLKHMFRPLVQKEEVANVVNNSLLPIAKVRFVPKVSGDMRVIENYKEANRMRLMKWTLAVLQWELNKQRPHLLGASVFSRKEVKKRLSGVVDYSVLVTLDIKSAFDSICMDLLLQMLEEDHVLSRERYALRKTSPRLLQSGYLRRSKWEVVTEEHGEAQISRGEILALLCSPNVVRMSNNRLFVQERGIPQGSCLSTLLCCYYLGHLERKHDILTDSTVILRWVDDYIMLASSKAQPEEFIRKIASWKQLYGIELCHHKTRIVDDRSLVWWCGMSISSLLHSRSK